MPHLYASHLVALLATAYAYADDLAPKAIVDNPASIEITINPEVRVSATLTGALLPPLHCGATAHLSVKIVNHGFLTARLEADLVGNVPPGVAFDFHPVPLRGIPEEYRDLQITLENPEPTDLTIAFRARDYAPDLAGRNRVHILLHCEN